MVSVEVRLFANLREAAGSETLLLSFSEMPTVSKVIGEVLARSPKLRRLLTCNGAFNNHYKVLVGSEIVFPENFSMIIAEPRLAILPPVSGG